MNIIQKRELIINGVSHQLKIHYEKRNSTRASITSKGIIIRIPIFLSSVNREKEVGKLIIWATNKIKNKPLIVQKKRIYHNDSFIKTCSKIYQIKIEIRPSKKNFTKLINSTFKFKISNIHNHATSQKYISKQLQKFLAKEHKEELIDHVNRLNKIHFNEEVGLISYKYTTSRWGVCKTKNKEINLSTRLLLAPIEILEYVIIHELAHLIQPNHSKEFWKIVKKADPNYKLKVKWLKNNASLLQI